MKYNPYATTEQIAYKLIEGEGACASISTVYKHLILTAYDIPLKAGSPDAYEEIQSLLYFSITDTVSFKKTLSQVEKNQILNILSADYETMKKFRFPNGSPNEINTDKKTLDNSHLRLVK